MQIRNDEDGIRAAIKIAEYGWRCGGGPFGAVITDSRGYIISEAHSTVPSENDPTAHAEIKAIQMACRKKNSITLENHIIYTTTEPCIMCLGAILWARISKIVFSTLISDSKNLGFNEVDFSLRDLVNFLRLSIEVRGPLLREEGLLLFKKWTNSGGRAYY